MRSALLVVPTLLLGGALVFACGNSGNSSTFQDAGSGSSGGGSSGGSSGCGLVCDGSGGDDGGPTGPCQGLQCAAASCTAMGMPETSLTGHVYDPAGNLPLYNVYVYIPNTTPLPIAPGNPECNQCEAPASGGPIIGRSTLPDGSFSIQKTSSDAWGVPVGKSIPLVIQVGKWRKQLVIPSVTACAPNDLDTIFNTGTGKARQLRLPANGAEGDMPLIAFTSGCDPAECFLRDIGIDDSEFAPPGTAGKHVQFFTAQDNTTGEAASAVAGGDTVGQTYTWWTSSSNLLQYDIVFNACECFPYDRGAAAYPAMDTYLKGGGRLFTTHYYGNWFIPTTGTADLQSVAEWGSVAKAGQESGWQQNMSTMAENDTVDQSFPKGVAYAAWLQDIGVSMTLGSISLVDTRDDILAPAPAGCSATQSCLSTRWLYNSGNEHPRYLSFNAPVSVPVAQQCGRAVYSDVHLSGVSNDAAFPNECNNPMIDQPMGHATNEKALEFLFFDLSSCVQNDTAPPPPPPPVQ